LQRHLSELSNVGPNGGSGYKKGKTRVKPSGNRNMGRKVGDTKMTRKGGIIQKEEGIWEKGARMGGGESIGKPSGSEYSHCKGCTFKKKPVLGKIQVRGNGGATKSQRLGDRGTLGVQKKKTQRTLPKQLLAQNTEKKNIEKT